jgi:hypothetical protein
MPPKTDPSTFHYHACAHAFNGQFTRPFHDLIEVQAATSLPIIGGHGHSRVENFQFREFIHFKKGYTHVSGGHQADDNSYNTLVTATLEGLNVLDVLTADRVVARLYSKTPEKKSEGNFTLVGSKFENLRIAGCPVHVELDCELFEEIPTFETARNAFEKKGKFRKIAEDPMHTKTPLPKQGDGGVFLCSCVKEMEADCPGVIRKGHSFHVQGFGTIFLGEVLIRHAERTLTMIRLELGSAVSGTGTVAQVFSNGRTYPPPP